MGLPWWHPLSTENGALKLCCKMLIHLIKLFLKPKYFKDPSMNLNETLSKALRKSINKSSPVMLFLLSYSITSYVVLMQSPMYLPGTNPHWSWWIICRNTLLSLLARTPDIILYILINNVRGRHESRYSLGLSPLGIKDIMPIVCESGNLFISKLYEWKDLVDTRTFF